MNQKICVTSKLLEELEDSDSIKNLQEREYNKVEELESYIAEEIKKHAERLTNIEYEGKLKENLESFKYFKYNDQAK